MKIGIGNDHAGLGLKEEIMRYLKDNNFDIVDYGTNGTESVDYPDYGLKVAQAVAEGECERGIVICGTGIGISVSANKVPGIRAALCTNCFMARMSREHNDANILALGERVVGAGLALEIIDVWLKTEFAGGRHQTRVEKIAGIEKK